MRKLIHKNRNRHKAKNEFDRESSWTTSRHQQEIWISTFTRSSTPGIHWRSASIFFWAFIYKNVRNSSPSSESNSGERIHIDINRKRKTDISKIHWDPIRRSSCLPFPLRMVIVSKRAINYKGESTLLKYTRSTRVVVIYWKVSWILDKRDHAEEVVSDESKLVYIKRCHENRTDVQW